MGIVFIGFVFFGVLISTGISLLLGNFVLSLLRFTDVQLYVNRYYANCFWVGYLCFISLLIFLNLFLPINFIVGIIIFVISMSVFFVQRKKLMVDIKHFLHMKYLLFFIIFFATGIPWVISKYGLFTGDTYLYHFGIINLANNFPVIKGIVTLHSRLSNVFGDLYHIAFFNMFDFSTNMLGALFYIPVLTVFLGIVFSFMSRIWENSFFDGLKISYNSVVGFNKMFLSYMIIILAYMFFTLNTKFVSGFPSETMNYFVGVILFLYFIEYIFETNPHTLFMIMCILLISLMLKLSSLMLVLSMAMLVSVIWFYKKKQMKYFLLYGVLMILCFLPYIAHNIIASGTLLFPAEITDLDLPWSNYETIRGNRLDVTLWARSPGEGYRDSYGNWDWIPRWLDRNYREIFLLLKKYLSLLSVVIISFYLKKIYRKNIFGILGTTAIFILPVFIQFFLITPSFRFAGILFDIPVWIMLGISATCLLHNKTLIYFQKTCTFIFSYLETSYINNINKRKFIQKILIITSIFAINLGLYRLILTHEIKVALYYMFLCFLILPILLMLGFMYYKIQLKDKNANGFFKIKFMLTFLFVILILINIRYDVISSSIAPYGKQTVESYPHDGVRVFVPSKGYSCGFRPKEELPCTPYPLSTDYTFKDPNRWWKGIYKRDYLEKKE